MLIIIISLLLYIQYYAIKNHPLVVHLLFYIPVSFWANFENIDSSLSTSSLWIF